MRPRRLKFYAITHDILGDVFWEVFRKGLADAAKRYEVDVEHLRPGKFSPAIQAGLIEGAMNAKPDGLICTIPDVDAIDQVLRNAIDRGIPVIAINAKDPRPAGQRIPYMFYIGGDDANAGRLAGEHVLAKAYPTSGMCVDHYLYEHICHSDRYAGFREVLEAAGIHADRLRVPGDNPETSARAVADYMRSHSEVDAILTLGPPGAQAVLDAQKILGPDYMWKHITFDVAQLQINGIRSGEILATIDSQQYLQGYLSVQSMWLHVALGFTMAADIYTGPTIVDTSNIDAAEAGAKQGIR